MNTLIAYALAIVAVLGFLTFLSGLPAIGTFFADVTDLVGWLFSALLPFRNFINLQYVSYFVTTLMLFETAYWTYELAIVFFLPLLTPQVQIRKV